MKKRSTTGLRRFRFKKWHIAVAAVLATLVLINMVVIFMLSSESREESGERSTGVVSFILHLIHPDFDELPYREQIEAMKSIHSLIRKAAHFCEYALLGFLFTGFLCFIRRHFKRLRGLPYWLTWVIPPVFCLLYAISDEVHQIFSNRGPSAKDVLIDFSGAVMGICLMHLILWIARTLRARKTALSGKETPCESPATD